MSSSNVEERVVHHNTHIEYGKFTCDGCKANGFGKTYRCAQCDYNLHDHCATCSSTLLSFIHPQHELELVVNGPERMCNICHELVEGLYYHCEPCRFYVHPLCSEHPQIVRYVPHQAHLLTLSQCGTSNTCMVCQEAILSWRYKCDSYMLDVHVECVNSSTPDATGAQVGSHSSPVTENVSAETVTDIKKKSKHTKRKLVLGLLLDLTVGVALTIAEM